MGFLNLFIYQTPSAFFDVTLGTNNAELAAGFNTSGVSPRARSARAALCKSAADSTPCCTLPDRSEARYLKAVIASSPRPSVEA